MKASQVLRNFAKRGGFGLQSLLIRVFNKRRIANLTSILLLASSFQFFPPITEKATASTYTTGSAQFGTNNRYLSVANGTDFAVGTGALTVEWWQFMTAAPTGDGGTNSWPRVFFVDGNFQLSIENSGDPTVYFWLGGGAIALATLTGFSSNYRNQWKHFAVTRSGTTVRLFVDGTLIGTNTSAAGNVTNGSTSLAIGAQSTDNRTQFPGRITNFHFVKGTALYTSAFSKPTAPINSVTNSKLLLRFTNSAGLLTDNSGLNKTVTNVNTVTHSTTSPTWANPSPPPTITSLSVVTGATTGGTSTVITGTNLTGTTGVTVGGVAATLGSVTSTTVAITTPAGAVGAKDVVLTTSAGSITSAGAFTYTRVNQATLNISATLTSANSSGTAYSVTPSFSTSGGTGSGTVTYAIVAGGSAGNCILSNSTSSATLTATTNGTCFIQASKAADNTYNVATSSNLTFTFNKLALSAATNVAATAASLKTVAVTWTAVPNASSYTVTLYDSTGSTVRATKTGITTPTSYTFTTSDFSFLDGTAYQVSVTAIATGDHRSDSVESTKVSVTTSTALAIPTSVTASPTGTVPTGTLKSITLTWAEVTNRSSYTVRVYDVATGGSAVATITGISSSATSTTITTSQFAGMVDKTTYYISVTAVGNGTTYLTSLESSRATVTTHAVASVLSISTQPATQTKTVGQSVTFSVTASATDQGTLSYVWQKNGTTIAGANSSRYEIANTIAANAGNYTVIVTNTLNGSTPKTITSEIATLTMSTALVFNSRSNVTITAGTALSGSSLISVTATGGRENRTYSVPVGALPAGLSLDRATGVISGTPSEAREFSGIKITVTDANDATLVMVTGFSITVNSGTQLALSIVTTFGTGGTDLVLISIGGSGLGAVSYALNPLVSQPLCSLSGSQLTPRFASGISGSCSVIATKAADGAFTARSSAATTIFFTAYVAVVEQTLTCPAGTTPSAPTGIGVGSCIQVLAPVTPTLGDAGAAPKITSLSVTTGLAGSTSVVITGTGFESVTRVQFGARATIAITKGAGNTTITVTVPTGATSGRVMVVGPNGTGIASQIFTVTNVDSRAPSYLAGNVNTSEKNKINLVFNENLAASNIAAGAFGITVAGGSRTVTTATISGATVTLTISGSEVQVGQEVIFTYTQPQDDTALQDAARNKTSTIFATPVTGL